MAFYDKILCYMWNNSDNHDKIYGIIKGGAYLYTFHGKRNNPENMKEVSSITVNDVLKGNTNIGEQYQEAGRIVCSKYDKDYNFLFLSNELIRGYPGYNESIPYWKINSIIRFNPNCSFNNSEIESIIVNNFYNFEENIKKKLAKKILKR